MKNKTLGIIWQSVKDNKLTFILVIIAVIATIVVSLLPALVLEQIINNLSQQKNVSFILVAAYFGLIAFNCFWESIREMQLSIFGQKVTYELRLKMCEKLTTLKMGYFTKTTPEENVSRFVNDVDTVENLFSSGIISMIADLGKIISVLMIIFVKNKGLTVIVLLLLPLIYLFTRFMQKRMLASQLENRTAVQKVTGFVPQTVNCIRMIHCFSAENYMCKRYDKYLDESYTATNKTNFYDAVYSPIILFVNAMIIALIFLLSATDNVEIRNLFAMSAGTSAAVISYVTVIFTPLESIGMEIQTIQSAIAGLKRIDDFLNEEQRIEGQENMIVSNKPCVSMQNVDFVTYR